jgi:hypothetical protein
MGLEGILASSAASIRAIVRLDQGQEPGRSGRDQGDLGLTPVLTTANNPGM